MLQEMERSGRGRWTEVGAEGKKAEAAASVPEVDLIFPARDQAQEGSRSHSRPSLDPASCPQIENIARRQP